MNCLRPGRLAANGRLLERVTKFGSNRFGHALPAEFAHRIPNRGFESLAVDSSGSVFAHDKIEGIAIADGGSRLVLANDSNSGITAAIPPSVRIASMFEPSTGSPDYGERLVIDVD